MRGGTEPEPATEAWFMRMAASMSMRISMPFLVFWYATSDFLPALSTAS